MKLRQAYPIGQTSAHRIKALLACLEKRRGAPAADAWLEKIRVLREDLDDESRLLPLGALRAALVAFQQELGADALDQLGPYLVDRETMGAWSRVLRNADCPEDAMARVDGADGAPGRTVTWETLEATDGRFRGRARVTHDPGLERDGLLARLRAVELTMVPTLFGFPVGRAVAGPHTEDTFELTVTWPVPSLPRSVGVGAASGVVAGALTGALIASASSAPAAFAVSVTGVLMAAAGAGLGVVQSRGRVARIEAAAQTVRVHALERSLAIREAQSRVNAGDLGGSVVAGLYRIGARMGSGASGVIYEANRITDGTPVAIKLLRAASAHDTAASDRLRREAEALGLAWHPNVVEVLDHGQLADGTSFLVMELLRGDSLASRLTRRGRLALDELYPIALQLADALVAVHAAGVVHRDLKPSNVFLVKQGAMGENTQRALNAATLMAEERVKVLDFGIARVEWEEMRITNTGAPMGTPGYMAPEQESGGEVDARSDIYAFGAMIYECLTGETPPPSRDLWWREPPPPPDRAHEDEENLTSRVQRASRNMPSAPPPPIDVPAPWRAFVEKACAPLQSERHEDARALMRELRKLAPPGPLALGGAT